jgi:periplasmic protein TonB
MRKRDFAARVFGLVGISLGTHMALFGALGFMPSPLLAIREQVEMEIVEPPPAPPPPPPPPAAEPPKEEPPPVRPKAPKIAAPKPAEPEPPKSDPKPVAEAPVDLTGVTLTGGDGASWSSIVGDGSALTGPAPRVGIKTGRDRAGSSDGVMDGKGNAPVFVDESLLSRSPVPPDGMNALLEQNYPSRARAQGVAGSALIRVQILADGRVGDMKLQRETGDYGFASACMKILRMRRWQAPLDRRGTPVGTVINYKCEFEVGY